MARKFFPMRLIAALLIGLSVFIICGVTAWKIYSESFMTNTTIYGWTRSSLRTVDELITGYVQQFGLPPKTLREITPDLRYKTFRNSRIEMVKKGLPIDGWGRPLQYSTNETTYTLVSLGRDGRPGGTGFDRDLDLSNYETGLNYEDSIYANPPNPSLRQFYFELPTGGMFPVCILSGLISFVAAFLLIRPGVMEGERLLQITVAIAATLSVTLVFGILIMQLHIPTGH